MDTSTYDVIILGAGIAGLAAAKTLVDARIKNFRIIEAKDRIGGRLWTVPFGHCNGQVELGAQWIHGEASDFYNLVKASGHMSTMYSTEAKGTFYLPCGFTFDSEIVDEVMDWICTKLDDASQDLLLTPTVKSPLSVGTYLQSQFESYVAQKKNLDPKCVQNYQLAYQWAVKWQEIDNGCADLSSLSLRRWSEFEPSSGNQHVNFKVPGGGSSFLQKEFSPWIEPYLLLNSTVVKLDWSNSEDLVHLKLGNGKTFTARSVLVTFSFGVLKAYSQTLFNPALPSNIQSAIESIGFGPIAKIFLDWDEAWWTKLIECKSVFQGIQLIWPKNEVPEEKWCTCITGFEPVFGQITVLVAWVSGEGATEVEDHLDSHVGEVCARLLTRFTGFTVPNPRAVLISKWNSDACFLGTFSNRSIASDPISGDLCQILCSPIRSKSGNIKIVLAGEGCSKSQFSTIHGAWANGISQSQILIGQSSEH